MAISQLSSVSPATQESSASLVVILSTAKLVGDKQSAEVFALTAKTFKNPSVLVLVIAILSMVLL